MPHNSIDPEDCRLALAGSGNLLREHLDRLRHAMPAHGNRKLHADQLVMGLLLAFFKPAVRSLRLLEAAGDFDGRLDLARLARSTTSDALAVFDPVHLKPLVQDLRERCPHLANNNATLAGIAQQIIAADGTYFTTLADVAWALHHTKTNGKTQGQVRANVQMDIASWTPQVVTVSGDDGQGEAACFTPDLLEGVLYLLDRNFTDFAFLKALLERGNQFVLRVRANAPAMAVVDEIPLTAADTQAGVAADQIVRLTGHNAPPGRFRLVTIHGVDRSGQKQIIRLLSSLTDVTLVAAHVIGAAYRLRWQIELFFKWLKTFARLDRLLSTSRNGITTQLYIAIIGVLLMYVQSGRRVSIYTLFVLGEVAAGQMTLGAAMKTIARTERERALNNARQARRRALKKLA